MCASPEDNALAMSKRYTVRGISDALDLAIKQRAKEDGKSINSVVLEAIAIGLKLNIEPLEFSDHDDFIGTWREDPEFDSAMKAFERIDEDCWK